MSLNPSTANVFYLTLRQSDWVSLDISAQQPVFLETLLVFSRVFLSYTYFLLVYPIYTLENWELTAAINLNRLFQLTPLSRCCNVNEQKKLTSIIYFRLEQLQKTFKQRRNWSTT